MLNLNSGHQIGCKQLCKINLRAARQTVLGFLDSIDGNFFPTARAFSINRCVVYDILNKQASGGLSDRSRVPKNQPYKPRVEVEIKVIAAKINTRLGPVRLSLYLSKYEKAHIPPGTISQII